ncbi:hypothetical protein F5J12DRAFT_829367 [Pisolithus orientalis]|uniref:uncharacterized protein n=1 Tax=Pisolithus orientalis TaxID=936130 RepID=UPI0022240B8D|nr:uncharacterized protein F5J12DRAFT_829367 [Pisolithus orientalis]KAI6007620.1 hypothetical protein F5J12DRAFT_829367 [Pisolithus orientalis]
MSLINASIERNSLYFVEGMGRATVMSEKDIEAAPDTPFVNPSESTPQRFLRGLSFVIIGAPSLGRFFQILEDEDKTEWNALKQRLITRAMRVVNCTTVLNAMLILSGFGKLESPRVVLVLFCLMVAVSCALLCVMGSISFAMVLESAQRLQPQIVTEIHTRTFKLLAVAGFMGSPMFVWLVSVVESLLTGESGYASLGGEAFIRVLMMMHLLMLTVAAYAYVWKLAELKSVH